MVTFRVFHPILYAVVFAGNTAAETFQCSVDLVKTGIFFECCTFFERQQYQIGFRFSAVNGQSDARQR